MKKFNVTIIVIVLIVSILCSCQSKTNDLSNNNVVKDKKSSEFAENVNNIEGNQSDELNNLAQEFNVGLLKQIYNPSENTFYSSLSINTALTGIYFATDNETQDEIRKTLMLGDINDETVIANQRAIMDSYKNTGDSTANIANSIWLDNDFSAKSGYVDAMKNMLDMEVATVNMNSGKAEETVNTWISDKTNEMIPNFYNDGDLENMVFVLLNAIYFKGDWTHPFEPYETFESEFNGTNGSQTVEFMNHDYSFMGYENEEYKSIMLPYDRDERFNMTLVLPNENMGQFVSSLTSEKLDSIVTTFEEHENVMLRMPKFELEETIDLKEILKNMGMKLAFSGSADFNNLTDTSIYLDRATHKAKIRVDELGSEASAVTEFAAKECAFEQEEIFEFIADRPFLFFISDTKTDLILFTGVINNLE